MMLRWAHRQPASAAATGTGCGPCTRSTRDSGSGPHRSRRSVHGSSSVGYARVENPEKAADLAFIEPKFSVKDDKTIQPAAKAEDAAGRFADKTAAELVAANTNAAQAQAGSVQPIQPAVNLAAEQKARWPEAGSEQRIEIHRRTDLGQP